MKATCTRRSSIVALALLANLVAWVGGAWACVPQPLVTLQPRSSGAVGTTVTVEALAVRAGAAEIRWNAITGPLLASASGPTFSVPVTIPQTDPGLYSVLVLERQPDGSVASTGRAAFLVTPADSSPGAASGGGAAPAAGRRPPVSPRQSRGGPGARAVLTGAALVVLGALGGVAAGVRLRRSPLEHRPQQP